jgi:hypothetical protein
MIGRARCLNAPDTRWALSSECRLATSIASAAAIWGQSALPARGEVKSSARGGFQRCPQNEDQRASVSRKTGVAIPQEIPNLDDASCSARPAFTADGSCCRPNGPGWSHRSRCCSCQRCASPALFLLAQIMYRFMVKRINTGSLNSKPLLGAVFSF